MVQELHRSQRIQRRDHRLLQSEDHISIRALACKCDICRAVSLARNYRQLDGGSLGIGVSELGHSLYCAGSLSAVIGGEACGINKGDNGYRKGVAGADKSCQLGGIVGGELAVSLIGGKYAHRRAVQRTQSGICSLAVIGIELGNAPRVADSLSLRSGIGAEGSLGSIEFKHRY